MMASTTSTSGRAPGAPTGPRDGAGPSWPRIAAATSYAGVVGFQLALAAGAPWGIAAWGGANEGVLPPGFRIGSAISAAVWAIVAASLGTSWLPARWRRRVLTVLAVLAPLSLVMNLATPSSIERAVWAPITAVQTVLVLLALRAERRLR